MTPEPTVTPSPSPIPTPSPTPSSTPDPSPALPQVVGDREAPAHQLNDTAPAGETPPPTPPPKAPETTAYAGLLFLGWLGSMLLGCVYVLFRVIRKRRKKA